MRALPSPSGGLRDSVAAASAILGAVALSALVGTGIGVLVTILGFRDTRSAGLATFLIATIATGLFASVVAFVLMVRRHHIPSPFTALLPALLWLIVATRLTWMTCKESFITTQNALWILQSGDQRNYELGWLIRGWTAIVASLIAAFLASRWILRWHTLGQHDHRPKHSRTC